MMVFFVDSSTNMNNERIFLLNNLCVWGGGGGTYSEETIERVK
jgi:hypothetical protein